MACSCFPEQDLEAVLPEAGMGKLSAKVTQVEFLNANILGIRLKPSRRFEYKAGQSISLYKDETTARCYSLASIPELNEEFFLNVRKVPGGLVSGRLFAKLKAGDDVTISEAAGDCFYVPGNPEQHILLIAAGCGLAPLYGIIRDALLHGHRGKPSLYHGLRYPRILSGRRIEGSRAKPSRFSYVPCVSEGEAPAGYAQGMVLDAALFGNPDMVNAAKRQPFFAGALISEIHVDPFQSACSTGICKCILAARVTQIRATIFKASSRFVDRNCVRG